MQDSENKDISRELLIEIDKDNIITDISNNSLQFLGYNKAEVIGTEIPAYITEKLVISGEGTQNLELTLKSKHGESVHCDAFISTNQDGNSKISLINIGKYQEIELWEKRFRNMIENTKDIIYLYDIVPEKKFIYVNKAILSVLGTPTEDVYTNALYPFEVAHPDDLYLQYKKIDKATDFSKPFQMRLHNDKGDYIWFEDNVIPFYNDNGELISIAGFCRNIQARKELERRLEELSYHDSLTGLFSNNYYELHAKHLDEVNDIPIGIIMCDLDNLKTINDSLGHAYGDKLLIIFANLLKTEFGSRSILIRKGGDEFIILIENTTEEAVSLVYSRFIEAMDCYNSTNPLLHLQASVGWAYSPSSIGQVEKTLRAADVMMYEHKMEKKHAITT